MKAIILARVSTEIQSLESQVEKLVQEAKHIGYDNYTVISGKESGVKLDIEERQTINQLKEHIETGEYDMVIIWEVSRLARRPKVLYEVRDYLIEHKVNLHCMTPNFTMLKQNGTIDPTASIVFALFGTMAEEEARLTKERMSRGKKHKQAIGGYIGGKPLFGYTFENDRLTINYAESEIVKKVYNMYESGLSTRSIALELMETGELKQKILNNANGIVQNIVSRPEYYGGESNISNYKYPAIITKTQFEKCREIAKDKSKEHTRVKKHFLCKRLLICKYNGYVLTPNKRTNQYKLYTIDKKYNMTVNIDNMDKMVWDALMEYVNTHGEEETNKVELEKEMYIATRKVQQATRNIVELTKQIDRIENRIIEGKMSESKGDKMIEEKKFEIKEQQDIIDKNNYIVNIKCEALYEEQYKIDYNNLDELERQTLVRKYIEKVELEKYTDKRGHYKVTVVFKDNTTVMYKYWSSGPWSNIERI